jgi:hypothetical protein
MENPFYTGYIERFIDSTLQTYFNCPNPLDPAPIDTPLSVLIEMAEAKEVDLPLALKFIQAATDRTRINPQELPFVFFGLRFLIPKFKGDWRTASQPLIDLMCLTAEICYQDVVDAWIQSKFKRIESGNELNHEIDFFDDEERSVIAPLFQFTPALKLEQSSINSLATCVTKQLFYLLKDRLKSAVLAEGMRVEIPITAPSDPAEFKDLLLSRLMLDEGIPKFFLAANELRTFLRCEKPPFALEKPFLDWAKFCVFSEEAPSFFENCPMDREILARYYPSTFRQETLEKFIALQKRICPDLHLDRSARLAARDALLAGEDLILRATNTLPVPAHDIYGVYKNSKLLFGWRLGESFEDWGKRLEHILINGEKEPPILGFFRRFWLKFHHEAKETANRMGLKQLKIPFKFQFPKGQENGSNKDIPKAVAQTPPTKISIVAKKKMANGHNTSFALGNSLNLDNVEFILHAAAGVLSKADSDEEELNCKIFVEKGDDAVLLSQFLLEITADRLVRRAISTLGPGPVDDKMILQALGVHLNSLHGEFYFPNPDEIKDTPSVHHYHAVVTSTDCTPKKCRFSFQIGHPKK